MKKTSDHITYTETERALDRLNVLLRARHLAMLAELRKITGAIRELAKAIRSQSTEV